MDYIKVLSEDLEKGYSKADLERLIGLPKNNLSGILKGDRKLSKKSQLKIEKWEISEKPHPLEVNEAKIQMELVKIRSEKREASGYLVDIKELEDGNKGNKFENAARGRDSNGVNNDEMISQYETELSNLGDGQFAKARKKWLTNKIKELKSN